MKTKSHLERLLSLAFLASAVTGIGLHLAGHGSSHAAWHAWSAAHTVAGLLWLAATATHMVRLKGWYKALLTRGVGRKSRTTLALSAAFLSAVLSGVWLLAFIKGPHSPVGQCHYGLGLLLVALIFVHASGRRRCQPATSGARYQQCRGWERPGKDEPTV